MKKIFLLVFFLLIFSASFSVSFATSNVANAKEQYMEIASESAEKINYELPYPGLLPDSPLYFLRVIRDKTVSFLISDPKKKSEFDLLQADKRLNAGILLFDKNKIELAISTISKAENYFEQAIEKAREADKGGADISEIVNKLTDSSAKHMEVLSSLEKSSPKNFKSSFQSLVKRIAGLQKEVKLLRPRE